MTAVGNHMCKPPKPKEVRSLELKYKNIRMPGSNKANRPKGRARQPPTQLPVSTPSASLGLVSTSNKRHKGTSPSLLPPTPPIDNDHSAYVGHIVDTNKSLPKELFVAANTSNRIMGTELTLGALVGVCLFPHVKFVCDPTTKLMYSQDARSICGVVLLGCSSPVNVTEQDWWEHAQKWMSKQVLVLHNSKNTQMKGSFMHKL